jgi:hypothetical protein
MEHLRKIIRKNLFELFNHNNFGAVSKPGEYSNDEMEEFLFKIISLVPWGIETYGNGPYINIPSNWPSSVSSYTKDSIIQNWYRAKKIYDSPDTQWYVWKADLGSSEKPVDLSYQRLDLKSILDIVSENPEAFKNLSISVNNEKTDINSQLINTSGD